MSTRLERLADEMEAALSGEPGWSYITQNKHGRLPKGMPCRVQRRPGGILMYVENRFLPDEVRNSRVDSFVRKFWYTQPCWYILGYENLLVMIKKLNHYAPLRPF